MNSNRTRITLGLVVVCALAPATTAQALNYDSVEQYRLSGIQGDSVAAAGVIAEDLDGDGHADILSAASDQLRLLRGDGRGRFELEPKNVAKVKDDFIDSEAADVNGDDDTDLIALGGFFGDSVRAYVGKGDGTFQAGAPVEPTADRPEALAVGDLDGDGDDDAVVGGFQSVQPILNDGAGGLSLRPVIEGPGNCCRRVAIGRVNGDAFADVVAVDPFEGIVVLLGDGAGNFTQQAPQFVVDANGPSLTSVALADLNADSRTDVVLLDCSEDENFLWVLHGDGTGAFTAQPPVAVRYEAGCSADSLELADVDGDARLDALVAYFDWSAGSISVLPGIPGGFAPGVAFAVRGVEGAATADFDEDGRADLAGAGYNEAHFISSLLAADGTVECDGRPATFVGQEPGETRAYKGKVRVSESPFGGEADDVFSLGEGKDRGRGGGGNDAVCGGASVDLLTGASGDDVLVGGPGPDVIKGGPGDDECIGGPGEDRFRDCETERQ
jgi:Ca2+-binding RTX toxin-like protein